jgi:hypothetical protein
MAVMVYALVIYQLRAKAIRLRTGAPYDDRLGPVSRLQSLHVSCLLSRLSSVSVYLVRFTQWHGPELES